MGNEQSQNKELTPVKLDGEPKGTVPEAHENGSVKALSASITANGLEIDGSSSGEVVVEQNGGPPSLTLAEPECPHAEAPVISEALEAAAPVAEEVKKKNDEKVHRFGKFFKKKAQPKADVTSVEKEERSSEDQTDGSLPAAEPQLDAANLKPESEPLTEPQSVTPEPAPEEEEAPETEDGNGPPEESQEDSDPEEHPVMNFFKTLVTPTKTTKKGTAAPDATKDQSLKENQPEATTTVAQASEPPAAPKAMPVPPPPPPEPPKVEIKGEPKPTPKEQPKAAAKEPEPSKGKSAKDTLGRFFRSKTNQKEPEPVEVEVQPVVEVQETPGEVPEPVVEVQMAEETPEPVVEDEKADPSKTGTLEAAPKPEPPPPVQEEKKTASKASFLSLFKTKAADPKKATPAPAAAAEAAQTAKTKEEPKPAAKSSEADSKPPVVASQTGDDTASVPKKLEKRNSIQLIFKILGQKRNSTDAGVQTEPPTVAAAAEKSK